MPLDITPGETSVCIRRDAFERQGLARAEIDTLLTLAPDEFRVERALIVVGPLYGDSAPQLVAYLEERGLVYFDDFCELSGNWPDWLTVFASHGR